MTFVVSSPRSSCLRQFSGLLFAAFPGTIIYGQPDANDAVDCVKTHHVDAVFVDGEWDAASDFDLLCGLRRIFADLPIYVFADDDQYEDEALWNEATGYLLTDSDVDELRDSVGELLLK